MIPITGGGSFTRQNIQQINQNFAAVSNPDLWVRPQNGLDTNPGTYEAPLATFAGTNQYLRPGMVIGLLGTAFECWTPPNGGGSTWLNVTHTTSATASSLVKIGGAATETKVSQGWKFVNLFMNNSSSNAGTGCVELQRGDGAGVDAGRDASHFSAIGCKFTGGNFGIIDQGGASFVSLSNCEFFNFTKASTGSGIAAGTATDVALPLQWVIDGCRFWNNVRHLVEPLSSAVIQGNSFSYIGSSLTTTSQMILTNGKNNSIHDNYFEIPYNTNLITGMFALGTNDRFFLNSFATAVTTTIYGFGSPSS